MDDLLIELGCEELPAASVRMLAEHLGKSLSQVLNENGLCNEEAQIFATPRRIAARLKQVGSRQDDVSVERRGPAMAAAYKDGEPTKALLGFLRSAGAEIGDIKSVSTPKGEWVVVQQMQSGKTLAEILSQAMPGIVKTMPMPRRMRWGEGTDEFLRPVVWLLAVHGDSQVPLNLLGLSSDKFTYGHRFHAPQPIAVKSPAGYEDQLAAAYVVADPQKRRDQIVAMVNELASQIGGTPVLDDDLVDEVNALVEWPVALAGKFDAEFLEIPKEALIQTMQENQRYFALLDNNAELMPAFITVANIESSNPQTVVDGNERVIRPRFADTMFFWNQDKQRTLESHQPELSRLLFQEKLGSVADKIERMGQLTDWLSKELNVDAAMARRAVSLCKCDLNTEIVKELAKMQGICGRYYAERDGESAEVAEAMEQHYFPKQAGGALPSGDVSQVVSLADKVDTLVGIFGLGMKPTGAKDPFALRRASIALVRIIVEQQRDLDLQALMDSSAATYISKLAAIDTTEIVNYVLERLRGYLVDQGNAADVVDAVLAKSPTRPLDIAARVSAMQVFRKTDAAIALSAASKRIGNLLKKVDSPIPDSIDDTLFSLDAESSLFSELSQHRPLIESAMENRDYALAMQQTAQLREPVDRFFDEVMVMDEDQRLRANRLALLNQVNILCCGTAELALLRPDDQTIAESIQ